MVLMYLWWYDIDIIHLSQMDFISRRDFSAFDFAFHFESEVYRVLDPILV